MYPNENFKFLLLATILSTVLIAGCSVPKKAPGWPDGEERPINAVTPTAAGTNGSVKR